MTHSVDTNCYKHQWEHWASLVLEVLPDLKGQDTRNEISGIEKLLQRNGLRMEKKLQILDSCCGWGRHCIELAKRGYRNVTGIDFVETFINRAKNETSEDRTAQRTSFVCGDLRDFITADGFGLVLNMWTSFGFYDKDSENFSILKKIYSLVKPGGFFLLDIVNRGRLAHICCSRNGSDYITGNRNWWYNKKKAAVGLAEVKFSPKENTAEYTFAVFSRNTFEKNVIRMKIYPARYLKDLLTKAGFKILNLYGDYNGIPYSLDTPRLIAVCNKPVHMQQRSKSFEPTT